MQCFHTKLIPACFQGRLGTVSIMWKETWLTSTQEAKVVRRKLKYPALRCLAPRLQCFWQHLQHNLLSSWPTWCTETTRNIKPRSSTRPNDVRQHMANQQPESVCWTRYCIWCQALFMDIQRAWWQHASANPESWGFHSGVNFNCQDVLSNWSYHRPLYLFSKCCHFFWKMASLDFTTKIVNISGFNFII